MPETRVFAEALSKGLNPVDRLPVNTPVLAEACGFRPSPTGMREYRSPEFLVNAGGLDWPFPQIHQGQSKLFSFGRTSVRTINPSTGAAIILAPYQARSKSTGASIPAGGVWHIADWGEFFMATNGACLVYYDMATSKLLVETACYPKTLCSFRDRPVFGNIVGYFAEWNEFWTTWLADNPDTLGIVDLVGPILTANAVAWGSIEGGDALSWFRSDLAETGYLVNADEDDPVINDSTNPIWLEHLRKNQLGYWEPAWPDEIVAVKALDAAVIVYGKNHVTALVPNGVTFGERLLVSTGVAERGAVGGDTSEHLFLNADGVMFRITNDLNVERLDYSPHLADLLGDELCIVRNPVDRDTWISSRVKAYLLTPHGLVECRDRVTGAVLRDGVMTGTFSELRSDVEIGSWPIDMGTRAQKTLTGLTIASATPSEWMVEVYYRDHLAGGWKTEVIDGVGRSGFVPLHLTGVEFSIRLMSDTEAFIDYVELAWHGGGKKHYGSLQ